MQVARQTFDILVGHGIELGPEDVLYLIDGPYLGRRNVVEYAPYFKKHLAVHGVPVGAPRKRSSLGLFTYSNLDNPSISFPCGQN